MPPENAAAGGERLLAGRGVLLDVARKPFTVRWIESLLERMSSLGLNRLQLHLSDGPGYRAPSRAHPEIVSALHYGEADIRRLCAVAERNAVELVPDLDTPAHLDHVLSVHPEWRLRLADGAVLPGHLDYSLPEARRFVADLVAETAELFGARRFHLGGDEYFPAPWQEAERERGEGPGIVTAASAPQLARYAREAGGAEAPVVDGFLAYLGDLARMLGARGVVPAVWNDDIDPGRAPAYLPLSTEVHCWIRWNREKPSASDVARAGYPLVNANGDYLYVILAEDGIATGPTKNPDSIAGEWSPRTFMGAAGNGGDHIVGPEAEVRGAHLSIWCDHPDVMTEERLARELDPWLVAFGRAVR